ncbi:MerC domain-containing protein, partial [Staphylococcus aureus]
ENLLFEYWMIGLAFVVGVYALYHGYKKHHHRISPILLFSFGIILLFAKVNWHQWQLPLLIPAVICIVGAHYINYRLCRK